jgi:hypothetical protein
LTFAWNGGENEDALSTRGFLSIPEPQAGWLASFGLLALSPLARRQRALCDSNVSLPAPR